MLLNSFKVIIIGSAVIYCLAMLAMFIFQRNLMYFPTNKNPLPVDVGLDGVTVDDLPTPDGETIVVWHAPAQQDAPTVLFFHGNAGEIGDRADRFAAYRAAGFGVMFVSWRGYGGSTGAPTEDGILMDAKTSYDWLVSNGVDPLKIAVVGESLGTGAAVRIASEQTVGALVLGAPYTATSDVAAQRFPWLPVRILMKDQFRSIDYVGNVAAPTLVLHGTADQVIPYQFGVQLHDAINAPKTFVSFDGQGHEILYQTNTYMEEIAFLSGVFSD